MHIEAIAVQSTDGFIADSNGGTTLLHSPEDSALLAEKKSKFKLLVMGLYTYVSVKGILTLSPNILRVVLTHRPGDYEKDSVPNELIFISSEPHEIVSRMEQHGYNSMLIMGGSKVYSDFLRAGLINRFHITTEPVTFGNGIPLTTEPDFLKHATEIKHTELNTRGTSYTLYEFNK